MKYRKILAMALSCVMAFSLAACGGGGGNTDKKDDTQTEENQTDDSQEGEDSEQGEDAAEEEGSSAGGTNITLWTYPIGNWGDAATVEGLIESFNKVHPEINVTVEYLDYANGDDQVNTAIEGGQAPDLVMEGPERLVANWGAKGLMVDLSDLWTDEAKEAIYDSVENACQNNEGVFYEYTLCMTAHTMAINRDVFEKADALQYLDEEKGTWTTEGFQKAVEAVAASGQTTAVAAVYCKGQGGDQGTRALINNLYGGTFTNPEHTEYTANSDENAKALELLKSLEGINFDASLEGGDEVNMFCNGSTLAMAFCWNIAQEKNNAENLGFDVLPMAFPTESGDPQLCGGIWGFGIFDNGDAAKIEAAKTFIDFMANDETQVAESVKASSYWPVKDIGNIYEGDELMTEYSKFIPFMGDYYQVVSGWAEARTAWWNMLQQVGTGADVKTALDEFAATANTAAAN